MCTLSVSNVIYHKFSHGAAFYTLNGKNVNVMLELPFNSISVISVGLDPTELQELLSQAGNRKLHNLNIGAFKVTRYHFRESNSFIFILPPFSVEISF